MSTLPDEVVRVAVTISKDPAWLEAIAEDWPFIELAADADRYFGQAAVPFSKSSREALGALQVLRAWAGPESGHARGLAPYAGGVTEEEIMRAMATLRQLEDVLAAWAGQRGKLKKRFLPALARCVCDWHLGCLKTVPASGAGKPAVELMRVIAQASRVVLEDDSFSKQLAIEIRSRKKV